MKPYLHAMLIAILAASVVQADNTGRARIRALGDGTSVQSVDPQDVGLFRGDDSKAFACPRCGGTCSTCPNRQQDARVGLLPCFGNVFWSDYQGGMRMCVRCGPLVSGAGGGCGSGQGGFNPYPNGVPGTLVYPQHPFVRSPRDYFMWEAK